MFEGPRYHFLNLNNKTEHLKTHLDKKGIAHTAYFLPDGGHNMVTTQHD